MTIFTLLFAALLATQGVGQSQVKPPSTSLTIIAAQDTVTAGSEIILKIITTNISDHRISVPMSGHDHAEFLYLIDVRDTRGNQPPKTKYHCALRGEKCGNEPTDIIKRSGGYPVYLQPGETAEDRVLVDKLYNLTRPVKYTIQVQGKDQESGGMVRSNTITLTVTP